MPWPEAARRLETYRNIVWPRNEELARPNKQHRRDLPELADNMVLGHLFTEQESRAY